MNLYDAAGRKLVQKVFVATAGANYIVMHTPKQLIRGSYLLEVLLPDQRITRKLLKK
jgi:hypothetical protein